MMALTAMNAEGGPSQLLESGRTYLEEGNLRVKTQTISQTQSYNRLFHPHNNPIRQIVTLFYIERDQVTQLVSDSSRVYPRYFNSKIFVCTHDLTQSLTEEKVNKTRILCIYSGFCKHIFRCMVLVYTLSTLIRFCEMSRIKFLTVLMHVTKPS